MDSDPSSFPAGLAGQGLLLLRAIVALVLLLCVASESNGLAVHGIIIGASALIAVGLCTRWAASAGLVVIIVTSEWQMGPFLIGSLVLAVALTGPGSLSLDARLFGRRTISVRPRDEDDA